MAVIALLRRFAAALDELDGADGADGATPPGPEEPRLAGLFAELAGAIEGEVSGHFAFEEEALFPLLEAAGEGGLGQMLTEEHAEILPLGKRVAALARQFTSAGLDPRDRAEFRRTGRDFAALLSAHAEKEEMALLPLLDEILEPEDDARLAAAYLDGATGGAGPMDEVGGAGGPGATEAGR
jgi:hypothetical protein